jgi:hypothetical protein
VATVNPHLAESETRPRTDADPAWEHFLSALAPSATVTPNHAAVKGYLAEFPDLAAVIPPIAEAVRQEFGADAELALELYTDPEIADRYLTLYVRQASYGEGTIGRIDRACSPFEEELARKSGQLLVTTDFRPPRGSHGV